MKHVLNAAIVAGVIALATAPAMAQGVGVYVGPFGLGVGTYPAYHHHRVCDVDYYGYEHCYWVRDW